MPGYFDTAPIKDGLNEYLRVYQPVTENYEFVHHVADRVECCAWYSAGDARRLCPPP